MPYWHATAGAGARSREAAAVGDDLGQDLRQDSRHDSPAPTSIIIVMGVSGSGKSTIAAMLAIRLGWTYQDGDWFHPAANVEKMHSGKPLTDEDRLPWLKAIAAWIDDARRDGRPAVIACSALKRAYREILIGERRDVRLVFLKGDKGLIARRMAVRHGHFMPPELLDSQFATLQEPGSDEHPLVVSIEPRPDAITDTIVAQLGLAHVPEKWTPVFR